MINGEKVGLGIITCDREHFFRNAINFNMSSLDYLVVVDDGKNKVDVQWVMENIGTPPDMPDNHFIMNEKNLGVAKNKNITLKEMIKRGCDHLFLMEDDMVIEDPTVFEKYINASKKSGIQHFNYGPGSPFNRKQTIDFDLHNRHLLDQKSPVNPKLTIDYGDDVVIDLYEHTVAMFTYYTKKAIETVGFIDENYTNAWEHVDHTYEVIKAGMHPPFWWFADIHDSEKYVHEQPDAIVQSSIANNKEQWTKNVMEGREYYKKKHGHYPNQPPFSSESDVKEVLKALRP